MNICKTLICIVASLLFSVSVTYALDIEWVPVGDEGNDPDIHDGTLGSVAYNYKIMKYEVTNNQYVEFLNKVAKTDTYDLYNSYMGGAYIDGVEYGGITRSGNSGDYYYSLKNGDSAWGNRPVNFVSFYDAVRFANWIFNGQPSGLQNSSTTEDGVYLLSLFQNVSRGSGSGTGPYAFLPTENEWYKAAYYDGDLDIYYDYATQNDAIPGNVPPGSDTGNSANYSWAAGSPYWSTEVGAYTLSESAYLTYDQSGNMWEWNETQQTGFPHVRGLRGGCFYSGNYDLSSSDRFFNDATANGYSMGFRLAADMNFGVIPEPVTIFLLGISLLSIMLKKR